MNNLTYVNTLAQFNELHNHNFQSFAYLTDWDGNVFPIPETETGIINLLTKAGEENTPLYYGINWTDEKLFSNDRIQVQPAFIS